MEDEHVSGIFSCLQCSCCPCVHESSVLAYDPVESPPCWLGKSGVVEGGIFLPPPLPPPPLYSSFSLTSTPQDSFSSLLKPLLNLNPR